MSNLPNVCDEPDDRKRVWGAVHEQIGVRLLYVDRQLIWNLIAHELAEKIRAMEGMTVANRATAYGEAADLIDPEGGRA